MQDDFKSDVVRFTTHFQTCLAATHVAASCVNTEFYLDKITRELLQNKFALGR